MLRYDQPMMKKLMNEQYEALKKEYPEVVDSARDHILSLLSENDPSLMRAFKGEGGAEPHEYSALHEAFLVITHFLEQERLGATKQINDQERESWFRMYLGLPFKVIETAHSSLVH